MGSVFSRGTRSKPAWYGKYKERTGKWKMVPTHQPTKAQARKFIAAAEARIATGKVGVEPVRQEKTLGYLADYWLENHSASNCVSHPDNVSRMKHLREAFGKLSLSEITAKRIDEFKARMVRATVKNPKTKKVSPRWSPSTINRILALLRKMLNDAVRWDYLPAAPKVRLLPIPEQSFDFLIHDEAERFLSWTRENAPHDFPLYATAIYLGPRMGELYGLEWADVNLDKGLITFQRSYDRPYTKSKKIRHVRINDQLNLILKEWKRRCPPSVLAFSRPDGRMRVREAEPPDFKDHIKDSDCHAITFHDLRHTAASLMVQAGVSLRAVQQILGHCSVVVTERYAHLAPGFQASEAERLHFDLTRGQVVPLAVAR